MVLVIGSIGMHMAKRDVGLLQFLRALKQLPFNILLGLKRVTKGPGCFAMGAFPTIMNAGSLQFGSAVAFRSFREPVRLSVGSGGKMSIGDNVFINDGVRVYCGERIDIGANTKIGDRVTIHDSDFHPVGPGGLPVVRPVIIGKNVWIGARAIILAGTQIGDHGECPNFCV